MTSTPPQIAVTTTGHILTSTFSTPCRRRGSFIHFTLLSVHLNSRSIFVVSATTLLMHKVCDLIEQSDTLNCRTSAQPAVLSSCGKSFRTKGEIHSSTKGHLRAGRPIQPHLNQPVQNALGSARSSNAFHPCRTDARGRSCPQERHSSQFREVNQLVKILVYSYTMAVQFSGSCSNTLDIRCALSSLSWTLFLASQRKSRKHFMLLSPNILVSPLSLTPSAVLAKIIQPLNQKQCAALVPGESPSKENPPL